MLTNTLKTKTSNYILMYIFVFIVIVNELKAEYLLTYKFVVIVLAKNDD